MDWFGWVLLFGAICFGGGVFIGARYWVRLKELMGG